ncbi:hypothetical protein [Bacillus mycoides]|uniref:hypothetical protein n=1 Tax=Bacillus mycoides TaxID=1405 RepID=UPI003A812C88
MSWLLGMKVKRSKETDVVHEVLQGNTFLTARDARMFTKFTNGEKYIPLFQNMGVDDLVKDILSEVDICAEKSQKCPVDRAAIVYKADILRSLHMEFRLGKRVNVGLDAVAEHYAACRVTVICAIEVLEALGYVVRVVDIEQGAVKTSMLSIHW